MDGIVGGVPASGPSGWQGGEVFSEVQRWNRIEADGQMKTPWVIVRFRQIIAFARQKYGKLTGNGDECC
jgi:hypothetical protein